MSEQNGQNLQDNDYKYVMLDSSNVCLGAKYTFAEVAADEMLPFKMKAIIMHYIYKEADPDTTLESQFYYMEKDSFLYDTFMQLKTRVKVYEMTEKKTLFGRKKMQYKEKVYSLKDFVEINLAKKKALGIIICEVVISKLGMLAFNV